MKTILCVIRKTKAKYGFNVENTVYRMVKNEPVFIDTIYYNTGSYRGDDHEAVALAVEKGVLPKKCMEGSYMNLAERGKTFKIIQL